MPLFEDRALVRFVADLFRAGGMDDAIADATADVLAEGDRLGHGTHGLVLAARYLAALEAGDLWGTGRPEVLVDHGSTAVWDGRYLPGPWLISSAMEVASQRAAASGIAAIAIRRSHHTACLQAYLEPVTARGQIAMLFLSDPADRTVVPAGGLEPVLSSDPLAIGIPAGEVPMLVDMSTTIATNATVARAAAAGTSLAGKWLQDSAGCASDDPAAMKGNGGLLPVGGQDHGHKGTALALVVEMLSQGLAGHGRKDGDQRWGASIFLQVIDPGFFSGRDVLAEQSSHIAGLCRAARPIDPAAPVRLPGERALTRKRDAGATLQIHGAVAAALREAGGRYGLSMPRPC